jgi:hypothetical protein
MELSVVYASECPEGCYLTMIVVSEQEPDLPEFKNVSCLCNWAAKAILSCRFCES